MKAPAFLISGILSGKFVASGQQQKVREAFTDHIHDKHHTIREQRLSEERSIVTYRRQTLKMDGSK